MDVAIVDHGMGNLLSVRHAIEYLGARPHMCRRPEDIGLADRVVLPGVGAFGDCMNVLTKNGFVQVLNRVILEEKMPILGICLGMQILARRSEESPGVGGLGWINAEVVRLQPDNSDLRVPHVGWNDVCYTDSSVLFQDVPMNADFYFVHSFWMDCKESTDVEAVCDYGNVITAAIRSDNIFATQFHPEKSQDHGLKVLDNFLRWES